jgi:dihydrofolate reductase
MRELAILCFVTLDGVMQSPSNPDEDSSGGFDQGGWAQPYWDEVMEQVQREAMSAPYDMLFGHTTYKMFASSFSTESAMTRATKYVACSAPVSNRWANTISLTGDVAEAILELKTREGPLLQVHGSWGLVQTLLSKDLIDEFRIWTFPVLVGSGKKLFGGNSAPTSLRLIKTEATASGAVMSVYRTE